MTVPDEVEDLFLPLPDVSSSQTLADFKSMIEPIVNIPAGKQQIYFDNRPLTDTSLTLEGAGIRDGDMVYVMRPQAKAPKRKPELQNDEAEILRQRLLEMPEALQNARGSFPALADAVNDPARFRELFHESVRANKERQRQEQAEYDDPFNVEAQKKIEEMIRNERVEENFEEAWKTAPECKYYRVPPPKPSI